MPKGVHISFEFVGLTIGFTGQLQEPIPLEDVTKKIASGSIHAVISI